ncbi:MAG TPA: DUF72 domain-containing protein [Bacteroidia bacterium]|nr:DUF72 domain-containing protein [Bacteroidia bacterium]
MEIRNLHTSFYSGISGLVLPIPKYLFPAPYRDVSRLTYYATFFNSIEINSSFYKIPMAATVSKWVNSVNENFKFTFKLWKGITHTKDLDFKKSDVEFFFKSVNNAKDKKGCLLIQFPPGSGRGNIGQLEKLLKCVSKINIKDPWNVAVEFRNRSWYHEDVYDLLEFYKATMVIQDIPKSATPRINHPVDFIYIRFHGPSGNYRDSYSDDFLSEYAGYIKEWIGEGKTVYVYFNNTMGDAFKNSEFLNRLIYSKARLKNIRKEKSA